MSANAGAAKLRDHCSDGVASATQGLVMLQDRQSHDRRVMVDFSASPLAEGGGEAPKDAQPGGARALKSASTMTTSAGYFCCFTACLALLIVVAPCCYSQEGQYEKTCRAACWCCYSGEFLCMAANTIFIPCAYDVADTLGDTSATGWIIGSFQIGAVLGLAASRALMSPWRQGVVRKISSGAYLWLALFTALSALLASPGLLAGRRRATRILLLCGVRALAGLVLGATTLTRLMVTQMIPLRRFVAFNTAQALAAAAGIGVGPVCCSLFAWAFSATGIATATVPLYATAALALVQSAAWWALAPPDLARLEEAKRAANEIDAPRERKQPPEEHVQERIRAERQELAASCKRVWLGGLWVALDRGVAICGLQVASSLLLELAYGLPANRIGALVGCTFVLGMPLLYLGDAACRRWGVGEAVFLCALSGVTTAASLLLFTRTRSLLGVDESAGKWLVLAADCLVIPSRFFVNGIIDGLALKHADPGRWYSQENYICLAMTLPVFGRVVTPVIARSLLAAGGQDAYAWFQLGLNALTLGGSLYLCGHVNKLLKGVRPAEAG